MIRLLREALRDLNENFAAEIERFEMILHIIEAKVCGPHALCIHFGDGTAKTVDVQPLLEGPVFEPLRNPDDFARVEVDPLCGTVVWPNGADLAPEALHALDPL